MTTLTLKDWEEKAREYCHPNTDPVMVSRLAKLANETGSLFHASHLLMMETAPRCEICDQVMGDESKIHERCRLRKERGMPTPKMEAPRCGCHPCRKERGEI